MKKILFALLNLSLPPFLISCSDVVPAAKSAMSLEAAKVWLEKVKFKVAKDVNNNSPIAVHLLIFYDQDVLGEVSKMTADQYFEKENTLRSDNPDKIQFITWEIVPGQAMEDQEITLDKVTGVGALVFARYSSPGDHRQALADDREILISLDKLDFDIKKLR